MILPKMSFIEIVNELNKDAKQLDAYIDNVINDNKYQRIGLKHSKPYVFKPIFWTSKRNNKYFIILNTNGKKYMKKYGLLFCVWCYYTDAKNQKNGVMIIADGTYSFFRGHLFDRYAERLLNAPSMATIDVMVKFASDTSFIVNRPFTTAYKYKDSIFATVNNGAILGTFNNGYFVYKTFITEEMMKGSEVFYNELGQKELEKWQKWRKDADDIKIKMHENSQKNLMRMAS